MGKLAVLKSDLGLAGAYAVQKMVDVRGEDVLLPQDFLMVFDDVVEVAVANLPIGEQVELLLEGPEGQDVVVATGAGTTFAGVVRVALARLLRGMVQSTCDALLLHFYDGRAAELVERAYLVASATPRDFHMRDMGDAPERMEEVVSRFRLGEPLLGEDLVSLFELPAALIEDSLHRKEDAPEFQRIVGLLRGLAALARSERAADDLAKQVSREFQTLQTARGSHEQV